MEIRRNDRGYYEMYIDGKFIGNYDTVGEAAKDYERIRTGGDPDA